MDEEAAGFARFVRAVVDETIALLDRSTGLFVESFKDLIEDLCNHPIPENWRGEVTRFVDHAAYYGLRLAPESVLEVEALIAARVAGSGPFADYGPAPREATTVPAGRRVVVQVEPRISLPATQLAWNSTAEVRGARTRMNVHDVAGKAGNERDPASVRAPDSKSPPKPVGEFVDGLEVAGPGPKTTQSYRDKVQRALEILDPWIARWWRLNGEVQSRDAAGWFTFPRRNQLSFMVDDKLAVVVVDRRFTAGQTAQAIISEIEGGFFADSVGASYKKHKVLLTQSEKEFIAWRKGAVREAAVYASTLAEAYVTSLAALGPAGNSVVLVDDLTTHGLRWQQIFLALPLMAYVPGRPFRLRLGAKSGAAAREIILSDNLILQFSSLPHAERRKIAEKAALAATPDEATAIIEQELSVRGAQPLVLGAWVKKVEAMSPRARAYQTQITGKPDEVYKIVDVEYDGLSNGTLLEAKGPGYSNFIKDGKYKGWIKNPRREIEQAKNQLRAAGGVPVEWHIAEPEFAEMLRTLFKKEQLGSIKIVYTPPVQ